MTNRIADSLDFDNVRDLMRYKYKNEYNSEKTELLFVLIKEERWDADSLLKTCLYIINRFQYDEWLIAHWFYYKETIDIINAKYEIIQKGRPNNEINWRLK